MLALEIPGFGVVVPGGQTNQSPVCGVCLEKIPLRATWACGLCGQVTHRLCGIVVTLGVFPSGEENRPFFCGGCVRSMRRKGVRLVA